MLAPNVRPGDGIERLVLLLVGRIVVLIAIVLIAAVIFS
jgi:hypothetical protein